VRDDSPDADDRTRRIFARRKRRGTREDFGLATAFVEHVALRDHGATLDAEVGVPAPLAHRSGAVGLAFQPFGVNHAGLDTADHADTAAEAAVKPWPPGGEARTP
jgi:hypothetical protein